MNYKKVLVTGSSGFIGSHVADVLENIGYEVILFDAIPSIFKSESQYEIIGDILNQEDIEQAIKGCDAVYHFAAQADIGASNKFPMKTMQTNIVGTQNVLEAVRKHKVKRFMFASTIYVYSELGSFYRVSKQACEKIIEEYHKEYNVEYTILRFGSLYGPRANEFNGIQSFLTQALTNKKIIRCGDGNEIREYIHVKDAARVSVDALNEQYKNEHLIITGSQQIKVKDLLFMIKEILSSDIKIEFGEGKILDHYKITPYSYKPNIAMKITPKTYYDLGQGILDQIYYLDNILNKKNKINLVDLRKRSK